MARERSERNSLGANGGFDLAPDVFEVLRHDDETMLWRPRRLEGARRLMLSVVADAPRAVVLGRLQHELALASELDPAWAVCPAALGRIRGQVTLALSDPGGELLSRSTGRPWELMSCLHTATRLAGAIARLHERGLVHNDIRPDNMITDLRSGEVWLTGFGMAAPEKTELTWHEPIGATAAALPYMAPEQMGRTNRRADARSDLYSLGVVLYELLTGTLPFGAREPVEWIHGHCAKRPLAPHEHVQATPTPISALVLKLLAKDPDDRYQTAHGVETDLQRCLLALRVHAEVPNFEPGAHERPARLRFSRQLYGRARESALLRAAFARVEASGVSELVLVSGDAGVGKSALAHELQKALGSRAMFASGKFDQFKRDIPYATFAQALQELMRTILGQSERQLSAWRASLRHALGANGQLMLSLVPELALLVGEQAPLAELPPQERKRRFQHVFRRLIAAIATPERPLVLFLDDLQWLDAATLDLLEHLATHPEVRHLLLLGAFRSGEVAPEHDLARALRRMESAGLRAEQVALAPMEREGMRDFIADALLTQAAHVEALADLVHEKTGGNPFFATQFVTALHDGGLVAPALSPGPPGTRAWSWDIRRIEACSFTENIVELMLARLARLPDATRTMLVQLAYVGDSAPYALLAALTNRSEESVHAAMTEAVRAGLVLRLEARYAFLHDRIQEASYALLDTAQRDATHLTIGRLLARERDVETHEAAIFDAVNQLNRGLSAVADEAERTFIARLNLLAGQVAKRATAYAAAQTYLETGADLLRGAAGYERALRFELDFQLAECELLRSDLAAADARLESLSLRAEGVIERAAVACLRLDLFTVMDRSDRGVDVGLAYLAQVGVEWPQHPSDADIAHEYERLFTRLGGRPVQALAELPPMTNPEVRATMDVLTKLQVPALFYDENLQGMVIGRMANLSLEHGNSDGSVFAYCWLGGFLASHFEMHDRALHFADLSLQLVARPELGRFKARVLCVYGYLVNPWVNHIERGIEHLRRANEIAREAGDLTFVSYTSNHLVTLALALGRPLADVQREAEQGLATARKARFGLVELFFTGQLMLVRTLRGLTPEYGAHGSGTDTEASFERGLDTEPALAIGACWYWIRKLQSRLFADDPHAALAAAQRAKPLLWTSTSSFEIAEYHFYAALAHALVHDADDAAARKGHLAELREHLAKLTHWAARCPPNFAHRAALVQAELARLSGDHLAAEQWYERAIVQAHEQDLVNCEGLACELAGRYYAFRGLAVAARSYMDEARRCYQRWGADDKVRRLEDGWSRLRRGAAEAASGSAESLDIQTVIKASQALSGEILLDRLIENILRMVVEHAGAELGLLLMWDGARLRTEAIATTRGDAVTVTVDAAALRAAELPESVVLFAARARENVILGDASRGHRFASDPYFRTASRRSVACLPLLKQARVVGVLYLENNLTCHAFTPRLTTLLTLLASQAAISLENARLYRETDARLAFWTMRSQISSSFAASTPDSLALRIDEAMARMGRFFDADEMALSWLSRAGQAEGPSHVWSRRAAAAPAGTLAAAAFPAPLAALLLQGENVHIADTDGLEDEQLRLATMHLRTVVAWPLVTDGVAVAAMMIGFASAVESSHQTLEHMHQLAEVFLNALSRRQTLTDLGRSEAALQQAQLELAHATRLTALGELAASIAHEVNQPLAAIVADASAGLNWLNRLTPGLPEVRESLDAISREGKRAGDVISRIRALVAPALVQPSECDVTSIVQGVLPLLRGQLERAAIRLESALSPNLAGVRADAVELQQVVLNLVLNAAEATRDVCDARRRITVRSATEVYAGREWVVVAVEDLGVGIGSVDASRLFDAFYTTKSGGLGLGLSISRTIIQRHGGRLWAEPNGEHGSVFRFALPTEPPPQ